MNSYIANMPRKGLSTFLEDDERRKEEERFTDEVNFSTKTRVNTDKGYKEEFLKLFGFEMDGVDYDADVNPEVAINNLII